MSKAENVNHIPSEAEQLDQSVCGSGNYCPSQEKYVSNIENHTGEDAKDGAGLSNNNEVSLEGKLWDATEPLSDADFQNMFYETSEINPIDDGNLQSEFLNSCPLVPEFSQGELQKKCLRPPDKDADEHLFEHGHDGFYDFENKAVGESSKMPEDIVTGPLMDNSTINLSESEAVGGSNMMLDDVVPGQLMKNTGIEQSESKYSGVDIVRSPDSIPGGYTEVPKNDVDQLAPSLQDASNKSNCEQLTPLQEDKFKSSGSVHQLVLALRSAAEGDVGKKSGTKCAASYEKSGAELKSTNCRSAGRKERKTPVTEVKSEYTLRKQSKTPATEVKSEHTLEPSTGRRRGRPSKKEKTFQPEPDSNLATPSEPDRKLENASCGRKRGRKKKDGSSELHDNEFKRMRVHLRYLLHRISYEQNLIEAYSNEGWRGQSVEKIRPEKELQRAKLDINRSKLKIRGLFQRLDEICAEGQFPKSLFDTEGLIDSEDIFCAKCGSRELSPNNDIILCDGACDRGFHQLCLVPPLRTEEIPPGDEGWFCPACDCKFDCVELINDSMETKLSITHSWENIFSEAVAKTGNAQDDISGLPSDDSEDNDYNPNGGNEDSMVGRESSSDESDFSSASEDLEAIHKNDDQYAGLPSDDPEDDDYDPVFVDAEDQPQEEGSSSDFTSSSEDLNAAIKNDEISSKDDRPMSPSELVHDNDSVPVSGRRQTDKLDYKKLYDETYGNAPSDSSDDDDDDDWQDANTPKRKKKNHEDPSSHSSESEECMDRVTPKSQKRNKPRNASSLTTTYVISDTKGGLSSVCKTRNASTRGKSPPVLKVGVSNDSQTPETTSGFKTKKRPPYKKLGEEVIQRLYASFQENQYPDRSTKENLATELGLSPKQVNKWFGNTRWSVNHSGVADASTSGVAPTIGSRKKASKSLFQKGNTDSGAVASNGVDEVPLEASKDMQQNNPTDPKRKRKSDVGDTSAKRILRRSSR